MANTMDLRTKFLFFDDQPRFHAFIGGAPSRSSFNAALYALRRGLNAANTNIAPIWRRVVTVKTQAHIVGSLLSIAYVSDEDYRIVREWCRENGLGSAKLDGVYVVPESVRRIEAGFFPPVPRVTP